MQDLADSFRQRRLTENAKRDIRADPFPNAQKRLCRKAGFIKLVQKVRHGGRIRLPQARIAWGSAFSMCSRTPPDRPV